jgi:alginate O-acetyltransferase complex protein AlgI
VTFNSWVFAALFLIVLALHYSLAWRAQNIMLFIASLVFYGWWDWRFLGLMLFSAGVDYIVALYMPAASPQRRKALLTLSMCCNLGILGVFKYLGFFAESFARVLEALGLRADIPTLHIVLPVGISFYTFQSMAYAIEVYRGRTEPVRDPVLFFLFVSYFPTLVAGPIERPTNLLPQLTQPRRVTPELFASGCLLILIGLARKVLIADNAAAWVDQAFAAPGAMSSFQLIAAAAMFGIQIYSDFAGYSDMARGTSQLLGVEMIENFRQPYFASNIADFWRRWHMSLSTWLRDYLYIPLGGNRHGRAKTYRNLMLTMLLGGLWHGANWTFVVWGGLHGLALAVHKAWTERRAAGWRWSPLRLPNGPGTVLSWAATMAVVVAAWVFFRAQSVEQAGMVFAGIVAMRDGYDTPWLIALLELTAGMLFIDVPQYLSRSQTAMLRWPWAVRGVVYAVLVLAIAIFGAENHVPFIYFQF